MQLIYHSEIIPIHIQRSKRKTLCISVNKDGRVMVKSPNLFPTDDEIFKIVQQKAEWILKQRTSQQEKEDKKIKRQFISGYTFPYLGEEHFIEMQQGKKVTINYKNEIFYIQTPFLCKQELLNESIEKLRKELKKWYKKQAKEYVTKRVEYYQQIIGVSVTSVSIRSRKSQWGSCDSNGNLTFSWRLVMAEPKAIDYVVVHELCHRRHMDHSSKFWQEVKMYMPDYEERKQWLEENAMNLNVE